MKNIILLLTFVVLTVIFYFNPLSVSNDSATLFLTVSTFIFAILTGFFIARQNERHNNIRSTIAAYDGNISSLYRLFGTFGKKIQNKAGNIMKAHYNKILETHQWDYHFTHKSDTISKLGNLLVEAGGNKNMPSIKNETASIMLGNLSSLQQERKHMVAQHVERMPVGEWVLVIFLTLLLLVSLLLVPTEGLWIDSIMKGVFGTLIVLVVYLLHELDNLVLFEKTLGESSAKDILDIIAGKR